MADLRRAQERCQKNAKTRTSSALKEGTPAL